MKIGIIGGNDGLGAMIAAELAKRYEPEAVEVVIVECAQDIAMDARLNHLDVLFSPELYLPRAEPIQMPAIKAEIYWPEPKASRSRYHRTPKWKRNNSGSKYF